MAVIEGGVTAAQYLTAEEGRSLLEDAARRYLGIDGNEFLRRWLAGEYRQDDRPEVIRVAMLLPLVNSKA